MTFCQFCVGLLAGVAAGVAGLAIRAARGLSSVMLAFGSLWFFVMVGFTEEPALQRLEQRAQFKKKKKKKSTNTYHRDRGGEK